MRLLEAALGSLVTASDTLGEKKETDGYVG
jgi:hypothetical protein